ncbi:MAG: NusG domain II-containing protein [Nitrospirae bacterium]|uniref:NusG domain II-containing protein n=1 Tax=Candidatus Magnetobacterium casense TaxID=1455061 RepID=UPI0006983F4C|nr:NusG domain II-containing protein [Candidatus Magnetobacterium casensis]MBF0337624.1 NusG domain II-containing protein [Nitrospirota bacterium]
MNLRLLIKHATTADLVLLCILLSITAAATVFVSAVMPRGAEVTIEVNNKVVYRLSLDTDRELHIGAVTVEIKASRVRVKDADCPNKLCVRQGWIDRGTIICLPNRVVISVHERMHRKQEIDATTG